MKTRALGYVRTSSLSNIAGDSSTRQREAIRAYAESAGVEVVTEFNDPGVSGADHIDTRAGFISMLAYLREHDIRMIIVENASRFARDLLVQETGYAMLRREGVDLVAADDPDAFTSNTPTAIMVRQILGSVSEFEKANLVSKLRGARDRMSDANNGQRIEGRKGYQETNPDLIKQAKRLSRKSPKTGKSRTLREIAEELAKLGFTTSKGKAFSASQIQRLVG